MSTEIPDVIDSPMPEVSLPRGVEYLDLKTLKADPANPKAHDIGLIDGSIGRFGFIEPIVRDSRTGYLISGHGRTKTLLAMLTKGESAPEGVVAVDDTWLVPVITGWSSRTDSEARAALISLNKVGEVGGWVDEALLGILDELGSIDSGLDAVGFDDSAIEELRNKLGNFGEGAGDFLDGLGNEHYGKKKDTGEQGEFVNLTLTMLPHNRAQIREVIAAEQSRHDPRISQVDALLELLGIEREK